MANFWLIAFAATHLAAAVALVESQGARGLILADAVGAGPSAAAGLCQCHFALAVPCSYWPAAWHWCTDMDGNEH